MKQNATPGILMPEPVTALEMKIYFKGMQKKTVQRPSVSYPLTVKAGKTVYTALQRTNVCPCIGHVLVHLVV